MAAALLAFFPFLACLTDGAFADPSDDTAYYDAANPLPDAVAARILCDRVGMEAVRRAFARGFIFSARCPGNNANYIQAFVFADDAQGNGARALTFPQPGPSGPANPADSLSNVRFIPERRELTELFVNPEEAVCRTEGRWRLEGTSRTPRLVYWRQTRDCAGKRGWRVLIDKR